MSALPVASDQRCSALKIVPERPRPHRRQASLVPRPVAPGNRTPSWLSRGVTDAAQQSAQTHFHVALGDCSRAIPPIQVGVYPVDGTPDADPQTGLGRVDAATPRTPPCRCALGRLIPTFAVPVDLGIATQGARPAETAREGGRGADHDRRAGAVLRRRGVHLHRRAGRRSSSCRPQRLAVQRAGAGPAPVLVRGAHDGRHRARLRDAARAAPPAPRGSSTSAPSPSTGATRP